MNARGGWISHPRRRAGLESMIASESGNHVSVMFCAAMIGTTSHERRRWKRLHFSCCHPLRNRRSSASRAANGLLPTSDPDRVGRVEHRPLDTPRLAVIDRCNQRTILTHEIHRHSGRRRCGSSDDGGGSSHGTSQMRGSSSIARSTGASWCCIAVARCSVSA